MKYDIIIIGSGPGGYIAAERAGAEGKKVLLIEKEEIGGVCLNWGCIPTKSLLNSAKYYHHALHGDQYGVRAEKVEFDLKTAMKWKEKTVTRLQKGVSFLMKKNKVDVVRGQARFTDRTTVAVGDEQYQSESVLIATGSSTMVPPIPGKESKNIVTSREILGIDSLPKSLVVIGGGVIGMEFASLFSTLGVEVTVVEMLDEILPMMDLGLAKTMRKSLKNISFHLEARVEKLEEGKVFFTKQGEAHELNCELVLMATGRKPNTEGLGLDEIGLDYDKKGIKTDQYMRTNVPGVYAIGDVTGKSLLAHSASRMGEVAVGHLVNPEKPKYGMFRSHAIPWAVYTLPEAAGCGITEQDAERAGLPIKTSGAQMAANGRFLAENGREVGQCKMVVHAETGVLLGVHLLGAYSSEIIHSAAAMIEAELRDVDIREIIFPHPTVSEVLRDAVWEL